MFAEVRVLAHGALFVASLLFERGVTFVAGFDAGHIAGAVLAMGVTGYAYTGDWFWAFETAIGVGMTYAHGRDRLADDTDP